MIVLGHYANSIPELFSVVDWWYRFTPLRLVSASRFATITFFTLTSYLLCYNVLGERKIDYARYLSGRFVRIYLPFAVSVLAAWIACNAFGTAPIAGASDNVNTDWQGSEDLDDLFRHLALIGRREDTNLVGVAWSLVFQFRIWLFFPLIALWVSRSQVVACLGLAVALASVGLAAWIGQSGYYYGQTIGLSLLITPYFLLPTLSGIVGFVHRRRFRAMSSPLIPSFVALFAALLTPRIGSFVAKDVIYCVTAALIICLFDNARAFGVNRISRSLEFLGTISFPLYLYHVTVLIISFRLGGSAVSLQWLLAPSFIVSILIAHFAHRYIDGPLSKWWTSITRGRGEPRTAETPRLGTSRSEAARSARSSGEDVEDGRIDRLPAPDRAW